MIETIAQARGVLPQNILPGAGSSDLIFRALRQWLGASSHALLLDPTYGEYAHVLERVIGCTVDRLTLSRHDQYAVDLSRLEAALADQYDLVVLVNPNSPTGRHVPRADLERLLRRAPAGTRIWVDETYVEYAGANQSLEQFAACSDPTASAGAGGVKRWRVLSTLILRWVSRKLSTATARSRTLCNQRWSSGRPCFGGSLGPRSSKSAPRRLRSMSAFGSRSSEKQVDGWRWSGSANLRPGVWNAGVRVLFHFLRLCPPPP